MYNAQEILSKINILSLFKELVPSLKPNGGKYLKGLCPFHDDHNPSLAVYTDSFRFRCFACGKQGDVIDLYKSVKNTDFNGAMQDLCIRAGLGKDTVNQVITGQYDYHDENGKHLYRKIRVEPGKEGRKKEFFFQHGNGQPGRGSDPVLYNLSEVLKAREVIINEGERKCDVCKSMGLTATTLDTGSNSKLDKRMIEQLSGKKIVIIRDNDSAGLHYAQNIATALYGKCESLKIVLLPDLPETGDICDWVEHPANDRDGLLKIIEDTPEWVPEEKPEELSETSISVAYPGNPIRFIRKEEEPDPFPVHAITKKILDALQEYSEYGQQPISMIATIILAVISLVAQGHADVARDKILRGPISLNTCVIAESGERKTAGDRYFRTAVESWLNDKIQSMQKDIAENKAKHQLWEEDKKSTLAMIRELTKKNPTPDSNDARVLENLRNHFTTLVQEKPPQIIIPRLIYNSDTNPAALGEELSYGYPIGSVSTDEGSSFISSIVATSVPNIAYQSMGFFNKLWDIGCYENIRKTTSSIDIRNKRISCNLMMQKRVFEELVSGRQGLARGTGLMARFLLCKPRSTIGSRKYIKPRDGMPAKAVFDKRVLELLDMPFQYDDRGGLNPKVLYFGPEANKIWVDFYNETEQELRPFGEFVDIKDFTSKIAENLARIAACLHVFEYGPRGNISEDIMTRSAAIALWYLKEARRIMGLFTRTPVEEDAENLLRWLILKKYNDKDFKAAELLRYAPNHLRDRKRRDAALELLIQHRYVIADGTSINRAVLRLHPLAEENLI